MGTALAGVAGPGDPETPGPGDVSSFGRVGSGLMTVGRCSGSGFWITGGEQARKEFLPRIEEPLAQAGEGSSA